MKKRNFVAGYSKKIAKDNLIDDEPIICLKEYAEPQFKWIDGERTDEIESYQGWFIQDGTEPFKVKFDIKPTLPSFLSKVEFDALEGCEVRNNVYFRAKGVHEIED